MNCDSMQISHICYSFIKVMSDGRLGTKNDKTPSGNDLYTLTNGKDVTKLFNALKQLRDQYPDVKLMVSIAGADETQKKYFSAISGDDTKIENFVRSCKALIDGTTFDGIDLDWEAPKTESECKGYAKILKRLRETLGNDKVISTAVESSSSFISAMKSKYSSSDSRTCFQVADEALDFWNIMSYSLVESEKIGFKAPFFKKSSDGKDKYGFSSVTETMEDYLEYIDEDRLNMGLAFYGVDYQNLKIKRSDFGSAVRFGTSVSSYMDSSSGDSKGHSIDYYEVLDAAFSSDGKTLKSGWELWDYTATEAYCPVLLYVENGYIKRIITYDNVASLTKKLDWGITQKFGGVMTWSYEQDNEARDLTNTVAQYVSVS